MKRVIRYMTSDGALHDTYLRALHHADERYGNLLVKLAHQMVRVEKYTQAQEFIEENLNQFIELKKLHEDKERMDTEEDDEQ